MAIEPGRLVAPRWQLPNLIAFPRGLDLDWVYAVDDKRDLRIDLLVGFAVFVMIVDHFGGARVAESLGLFQCRVVRYLDPRRSNRVDGARILG